MKEKAGHWGIMSGENMREVKQAHRSFVRRQALGEAQVSSSEAFLRVSVKKKVMCKLHREEQVLKRRFWFWGTRKTVRENMAWTGCALYNSGPNECKYYNL